MNTAIAAGAQNPALGMFFVVMAELKILMQNLNLYHLEYLLLLFAVG